MWCCSLQGERRAAAGGPLPLYGLSTNERVRFHHVRGMAPRLISLDVRRHHLPRTLFLPGLWIPLILAQARRSRDHGRLSR
jgi:hypothetical protein